VAQNGKNFEIWAVHNEGRKLIVFEKSKLSNAKVHLVGVRDGKPVTLVHVVGSDPRSTPAVLDGRANKKAAKSFQESVSAVLDGSAQAPVEPVENFALQKKQRVPWIDADQEPEIDLGVSWRDFV